MPPVSRVLAYFATWHASLPHILVPHLDHPPPQFCEMNGSVCQKLSGGGDALWDLIVGISLDPKIIISPQKH